MAQHSTCAEAIYNLYCALVVQITDRCGLTYASGGLERIFFVL